MTGTLPSNATQPARNQRGAVFVLLLLALPLLTGIVLYVYRIARMTHERARMQELADVAALQAAAIQARGLNALALLNGALVGIEGLAAGVMLNGNGIAAGLDALVLTAPEGIELHKISYETFVRLRDLSTQLATLQDLAVKALAVAPAGAAQLPLLFETLDPLPALLPYPLPGLDMGLTMAPPVSARGIQFDNLVAGVTEEALSMAGSAFDPLNKKLKSIAGKECAATQKVNKVLRFGKKVVKTKFKAAGGLGADDVEKACQKLRALTKEGGAIVQNHLANLFGTNGGGGGLLAGFSQPLLLDEGYGARYQIAVAAARCAPYAECPSVHPTEQVYAIAQARAYSPKQPHGGDLFWPDFRATLVPVTVFNDLSDIPNLRPQTSNLPEGTWSTLH